MYCWPCAICVECLVIGWRLFGAGSMDCTGNRTLSGEDGSNRRPATFGSSLHSNILCCGSRRVFGMVSDGFQAQKRCSWIPGKERAERVLVNAISIDGRKSVRAISVRSRMCGRGGVASDVTITSQRGCTGSIGRRLVQSGLQALRRRVGRKTEKRDAWKLKIRSSEQGLLLWKRRQEDKRSQVSLFKKRRTRETCGEIAWKSRMRPSVAENWTQRKKIQRRSCVRSTDCLLFPRKCWRASRSHYSTSCKKWKKRRNDLMPEQQKVQKRTQKIQSLQDKRKICRKKVWQQKKKCGN